MNEETKLKEIYQQFEKSYRLNEDDLTPEFFRSWLKYAFREGVMFGRKK